MFSIRPSKSILIGVALDSSGGGFHVYYTNPRRYALMSNAKNIVFLDNKFKDKFMEALDIEIFKITNVL